MAAAGRRCSTGFTRRLHSTSSGPAPGARTNWCQNVDFKHKRFVTPEDLTELQATVAAAPQVRVLGSGHSFSAVCSSEHTLLSMAYMRKVLEVDFVSDNETVVFMEGGATLGDVVRHLAPRGMALKNIPSLPHVTIAGALATSTHGSGLHPSAPGSIASMCTQIDFVTHDGEVCSYRRAEDAEFAASVVHLGALGVVAKIGLDVVPAYNVDQRVYQSIELDRMLPQFEALARSVDSLTVGINFGQQVGLTWLRYFDGGITPPASDMTLGGEPRHEPIPFYESHQGVTPTCKGPWHDVPSFFMEGMQELNMPNTAMQTEYFVPLSLASSALQAIREVAACWEGWPTSESWTDLNSSVPVFHCEVRAIAQDGLRGLAPFGDRESCSIHFTWGNWDHKERIVEMVKEVEAVLRQYQARPHFGKFNLMSSEEVASVYPKDRIEEFKELCVKHDPVSKFRNQLVQEQIYGGDPTHSARSMSDLYY
mmetsp:Transcript_13532/g.26655  ORF Transcript_13532/g.26655 Transcript_13532/m.26655 type:complete len:480 (-) Transcript_13532:5-1444(-)